MRCVCGVWAKRLLLSGGAVALLLAAWRFSGPANYVNRGLREHFAPLVDAVTRYEQVLGEPPATLDALVPQFIESLPLLTPGPIDEFVYFTHYIGSESAARTSSSRHLWYELSGRAPRTVRDWGRPLNPDLPHTLMLILSVDEAGRLRSARLTGDVGTLKTDSFEPESWREDRGVWKGMARNALSFLDTPGIAIEEVVAILGPPDGDGVLGRDWKFYAPVDPPVLSPRDPDFFLYSFDQPGAEGTGQWSFRRR